MAEQDFKTTRNPGAEWRNESGDGPHSMTIGAARRAHPTQSIAVSYYVISVQVYNAYQRLELVFVYKCVVRTVVQING